MAEAGRKEGHTAGWIEPDAAVKDGTEWVFIFKYGGTRLLHWSDEVIRLLPEHGPRGWVDRHGYASDLIVKSAVACIQAPAAIARAEGA